MHCLGRLPGSGLDEQPATPGHHHGQIREGSRGWILARKVGPKDIYKLIDMENTPVKSTFIETELKKFETEHEITETSLTTLAGKYKDLTVNGVDDREGLKAVESARKELKKKRVEIKKISEELRESAVKFQKAVISREKELVGIIEPVEERLIQIEDDIWKEKERLREEAEKKESDRIQNMLDQLNDLNYAIDFHSLKGMTDEQFAQTLTEAREAYEKQAREMAIELEREKERVRLQEEARKAEEERLAKERKEVERMQAEMRAAQEKLEIEQAKVRKALEDAERERKAIQEAKEAEEREKKRLAELEEAKKQAAEQARIEAEAKAALEAKQKLEREQKEKEEAEEKLLAGADKAKFEKLQYLIETNFLDEKVIIWLHFKSKKGKVASARVKDLLRQAHQICVDNV